MAAAAMTLADDLDHSDCHISGRK